MYSMALAKHQIFDFGKIVLLITLMLLAPAIFSTPSMSLTAYDSVEILRGYIQERTIYEKSNDNALFLLQNKWEKELKRKYGNNKIKSIENGVFYIPINMKLGSRKIKINVTEINRQINPKLEIIPKTANETLHSKSKINRIAKDNNAIIAINGSYFKQDTGTTLGVVVINNEIISGPIYERAGLGISDNGFKTARINFSGEIKGNGHTVKIHNINQPRLSANHVLIYTSKWGTKSPVTSKPSVYIAVKNNRIIKKSNKPLNIEKDSIVISAPNGYFKTFNAGDVVELNYKLNPEWENVKHIISGGPYLIKQGSVFIDTESEKLKSITGRNPRTAIGYTSDNVMIMVTVEGRKEGNSGVTLQELAKIMKDLDCYEAINLDGGSSTSIYINGKTYSGTNIKGSVPINNAIIVRNKKA